MEDLEGEQEQLQEAEIEPQARADVAMKYFSIERIKSAISEILTR